MMLREWKKRSLIANGGICGDKMRIHEGSERFVDVYGLDGHKVNQLRIFNAQALAIATLHQMALHQMALLGKWKCILFFIQMESLSADINDQS
jgi:hypothetical protein